MEKAAGYDTLGERSLACAVLHAGPGAFRLADRVLPSRSPRFQTLRSVLGVAVEVVAHGRHDRDCSGTVSPNPTAGPVRGARSPSDPPRRPIARRPGTGRET